MLYLGGRISYWEGKATFGPTSSEVEVFVDGSADDDMQEQHQFFRRIEEDWPHLSRVIGVAVLNERRNWEPDWSGNSVWDCVKVVGFSITRGSYEDADWEVFLEESSERDYHWMVQMRGSQPQGVAMDD
jgi:hypothetical protein